MLVRRQQRRFGPFTQAGVSFGVLAGVTIVALILACGSALLAVGVLPSAAAADPPTSGDQGAAVGFLLIVAGGYAAAAVIAARRQLREHPVQLERDLGTNSTQLQPSEAG
jgi:hypothetical protein